MSNSTIATEAYEAYVAVLEKKIEDADEDADTTDIEAKVEKLNTIIAGTEKQAKAIKAQIKQINAMIAKLEKGKKKKKKKDSDETEEDDESDDGEF